jgi:hypothetical protein
VWDADFLLGRQSRPLTIAKPFERILLFMWPFSLKTALRNRWWTLAFAGVICWQAYDFAKPDVKDDQIASAEGPIQDLQKPMSDAEAKALEDALGAPQDSAE